jgi:hypothetical protein
MGFKSTKFKKLLPAQKHILDKYSEDYGNIPDTAVELPTGGGKEVLSIGV